MKHTDFMFIKAIFESPTPPFQMKIRLVYTEGNVCNDQEKATLKYVSPFRQQFPYICRFDCELRLNLSIPKTKCS